MKELVLITAAVWLMGDTPSPGPKPGERLPPYMSIVSLGDKRGQQHCFV